VAVGAGREGGDFGAVAKVLLVVRLERRRQARHLGTKNGVHFVHDVFWLGLFIGLYGVFDTLIGQALPIVVR